MTDIKELQELKSRMTRYLEADGNEYYGLELSVNDIKALLPVIDAKIAALTTTPKKHHGCNDCTMRGADTCKYCVEGSQWIGIIQHSTDSTVQDADVQRAIEFQTSRVLWHSDKIESIKRQHQSDFIKHARIIGEMELQRIDETILAALRRPTPPELPEGDYDSAIEDMLHEKYYSAGSKSINLAIKCLEYCQTARGE